MLLLGIQADMADDVQFARHEAPFKGGMIHGLVENALAKHDPDMWRRLTRPGQAGEGRSPSYALVAPSDLLTAYPAGHSFHFGLMLFGGVALDWRRVLDSVIIASQQGLGAKRVPFAITDVSLAHPSLGAQSLADACRFDQTSPAHASVQLPRFEDASAVTLELLSPTLIDSEGRRRQELGQTPAAPMPLLLTSVIGSLKRRLQSLEPQLAADFQFEDSAWRDAEHAIRACRAPISHSVRWAKWQYGSRHTPGGAELRAVIGQLSFAGHIPAAVVALLDIGQWLALGQKCTLGQGWYRIQLEDAL